MTIVEQDKDGNIVVKKLTAEEILKMAGIESDLRRRAARAAA